MAGPPVRPARSTRTARWRRAWAPRSSWPPVPQFLRLREPGQGHGAVPGGVLPDLRHGGELAGCRAVAVPAAGRRGASTSTPSTPADAERALLLWSNSPSNPTGGLDRPGAGGGLGPGARDPGVLRRVLRRVHLGRPAPLHPPARRRRRGGGALPLQAVEPGRGAGRLLRRRPGAGRVPPRRPPARRADGARPGPGGRRRSPSTTTRHVEAQRERYRERLAFLAGVLWRLGCRWTLPEGGFYLWVPVPSGLARRVGAWPRRWPTAAGILVSPAISTARTGAAHVRVAVVQPLERLELVAERLGASGEGRRLEAASGWTRLPPGRPPPRRSHRPEGDVATPIHADRAVELWDRAPSCRRRRGRARVVTAAIELLDTGQARVAEVDPTTDEVVVHEWLKKRSSCCSAAGHGDGRARAVRVRRQAPAQARLRRGAGVRAVPGPRPAGARSSAAGWCCMPSYVNIGARVGAGSMVDTWATVGSCAQIGERVHLSGGVGIGGVLEPPNAVPVIVEDDAIDREPVHGHRGRPGRQGAVLGAGTILDPSIPVIDAETGEEIARGRVPPWSSPSGPAAGASSPAGSSSCPACWCSASQPRASATTRRS